MKKCFVFCGMFFASFLLVNRVDAMSCHEGCAGHQHEERSAEKSEKATVQESFYSNVYVCPMHPEVKSDKPGKCPQCGMKLEKKQVLMTYACPEKDCDYKSAKSGKCPKHKKELSKCEMMSHCPATGEKGKTEDLKSKPVKKK